MKIQAMTETKTVLGRAYSEEAATRVYEDFQFDAYDSTKASGLRQIGARVERFMARFYEEEVERDSCRVSIIHLERRPGTYFAMRTSALRDGQEYGASQPDYFFETEAEREAAIARYLKGAEKRAMKKDVRS